MNFLKNLFGKKTYKNANRLEELLQQAATDHAYRPEFYRQIFHHKLYVLGKVGEGNSLSLINRQTEEGSFAYAYTSLDSLKFVLRNKKEGLPYIEISSLDLFRILSESNFGLILNSELDYGRIFLPQELKQVLNDEQAGVKAHHVEKGSEVSIGIPSKVPVELVKSLQSFVKKTSNLEDIYFALQVINGELSYILALELRDQNSQKMQEIFKDISVMLNEMKIDHPVDMTIATERYRESLKLGSMISCLKFESV